MIEPEIVEKIIKSRESIPKCSDAGSSFRKSEAEGGCGVIGIACSEKIPGRHLLQSLRQMRNRGNGKGGGIAAVGLVPQELGVSQEILENDYLLTIAYLDLSARSELEGSYIDPTFEVDHVRSVPRSDEFSTVRESDVRPPEVVQYFVRVRSEVVNRFLQSNGSQGGAIPLANIADEIVY